MGERSKRTACLLLAAIALGAATAYAEPIKCQRAILTASTKVALARIGALGKCEQAKRQDKLPSSTVCATEPKTASAIAKATTKMRAVVASACGGKDKDCTTPGDDAPGSIAWPPACPDFEGAGCTNTIGTCEDVADCLLCVNDRAVDQAVGLLYGAPANDGFGTTSRCQNAIGKAAGGFFAAKTKALAKCWDARYRGKHASACPAPGDGKAAAVIAKAEAKMDAAIAKACADATIGAPSFASQCPSVTVPGGPACGGPITSVPSLIACVGCVAEFKVDCEVALAVPGLAAYPAECVVVPPTPTPTATSTATATLTATPTITATATPTLTASRTPTPTPTPSVSSTPTLTASATATVTASATVTVTATATPPPAVTPTATVTPSGLCGNGVINAGENCDDGNTLDCDACPSDCKTAPPDCTPIGTPPNTTRAPRPVQLTLPAGGTMTSALFCLKYPTGVVGLPGIGNAPGRISGFQGQTSLNDFNNAARIAVLGQQQLSTINLTVSFDLCAGATAPPPTAFNCSVVSASSAGTSIPPEQVVCTPVGP